MSQQESLERQFKGVWIPREIWHHPKLTWMQKCLWAEINSLSSTERPCTASNEYLAKIMGSTAQSVNNMISALKSLGLVHLVGFDGRVRRMTAEVTHRLPQTSPTGYVCDNSAVTIDTSRDSRGEKPPLSPKGGIGVELPSFGKEFEEAWASYVQYRKERKLPALLPRSVQLQMKKFREWGREASIQAIEDTIAKGYQGIFEPKNGSKPSAQPKIPPQGKYLPDGRWQSPSGAIYPTKPTNIL